MQRWVFSKVKIIKINSKLLLKNIYDSIIYSFARNKRASGHTGRVVFVCMGNVCRSVFAEYLMRSITKGELLSIGSCGLKVEVRNPSPLEAILTSKTFGLNLEGHLSKGLQCCDLENADLILAMELWQFRELIELFPHKKENIRLLREFAPFPENILCNINDPFGQPAATFEKCFRQIERSISNINTKVGS